MSVMSDIWNPFYMYVCVELVIVVQPLCTYDVVIFEGQFSSNLKFSQWCC